MVERHQPPAECAITLRFLKPELTTYFYHTVHACSVIPSLPLIFLPVFGSKLRFGFMIKTGYFCVRAHST